MISKKDFQKIAEALHQTKVAPNGHLAAMAQWRKDVEQIADALSNLNPRFKMDRFLSVCLGENKWTTS